LARAAERAGDPDTANLAQQRARASAQRPDCLTAELDAALEIALLAE
jgi:hypothetical protein